MEYKDCENYEKMFLDYALELDKMEKNIANNGFDDAIQAKGSWWLKNKDRMYIKIRNFLKEDYNGNIGSSIRYVALLMLHVIDCVHLVMEGDVNLCVDKYRQQLKEIVFQGENRDTVYNQRLVWHMKNDNEIKYSPENIGEYFE